MTAPNTTPGDRLPWKLVRRCAVVCLLAGCLGPASRAREDATDAGTVVVDAGFDPHAGDAGVVVYAFVDFPPDEPVSHSMSGATWDTPRHALWVVPDDRARVVQLTPSADFREWIISDALDVTGVGAWDAEGVVRMNGAFYLADESGPLVLPIDATGAAGAALPLPGHFSQCRPNRALESLSASPDGRYLFTANEAALTSDGPLATGLEGTLVRVLRFDLTTGEQAERAYRTEPVAGGNDLGVSDVAAVSPTRLVVMERSFVAGVGNGVQLYVVDFAAGDDVLTMDALPAGVVTLEKTLLVDLAGLPDDGLPEPPEPQRNRILANFEGLALGPSLGGPWRLLFLVSDDNASRGQAARLLVLAATGLE